MKKQLIVMGFSLLLILSFGVDAFAESTELDDSEPDGADDAAEVQEERAVLVDDWPRSLFYFGAAHTDLHGYSLSTKMPLVGTAVSFQYVHGLGGRNGKSFEVLAQKSQLAQLSLGQLFVFGGAGWVQDYIGGDLSNGVGAIAGLGFEFRRTPTLGGPASQPIEVAVEYRPMVTFRPSVEVSPDYIGVHLRRAFFFPPRLR